MAEIDLTKQLKECEDQLKVHTAVAAAIPTEQVEEFIKLAKKAGLVVDDETFPAPKEQYGFDGVRVKLYKKAEKGAG